MPITKEEQAKKQAAYYQANKERIKERDALRSAEIHKRQKVYRENNKEKIAENNKEWRDNNKDKMKTYKQDNKERDAKKMKEYAQTEGGRRTRMVADWNRRGLVPHEDTTLYDIYDNIYLPCTHCMVCNTEFPDSRDRCLDHDHSLNYDNIRQVICQNCNRNDNWRNKI